VSLLRRVRHEFGITAPRMAVRTRLPWWGSGALVLGLAAVVLGMWWWAFDFGQVFGGFNRKEVDARLQSLDAEAARLRAEAAELRTKNSQLESDLAMTRGAQDALQRQVVDLASENAQLKDDTTFLQKLVADSSKQVGLSIPRLTLERENDTSFRYNLIVVRGGNPRDEFDGRLELQAEFAPESPPYALTLPDDQPELRPALTLKFKYYQRVEGSFRVPDGSRLVALIARVYEKGNANPRVTRTLTNS